jgi:hypothetical protein
LPSFHQSDWAADPPSEWKDTCAKRWACSNSAPAKDRRRSSVVGRDRCHRCPRFA